MKRFFVFIILVFTFSYSFSFEQNSAQNFFTYIKKGNFNKIEQYIKRGFNINTVNKYGTPLIIACKTKNLKIVKYLIKKGADVNKPSLSGLSPLMAASGEANLAIVEYLLKKRALINAVDNSGQNAFFYAVKAGKLNVIQYLINNGINKDHINKNGQGVLYIAMTSKKRGIDYVSVTMLLIKNNLNLYKIIDTKTSRNALMIAISSCSNKVIIEILKNYSSGMLNLRDSRGYSALMLSAWYRRNFITELILTKNADVNISSWHGVTVLMIVVKSGDLRFVKKLISKRAFINYKTRSGRTALWYAEDANETIIAKILKKHGARKFKVRGDDEVSNRR